MLKRVLHLVAVMGIFNFVQAATITLDESVTHQTIEGFGGCFWEVSDAGLDIVNSSVWEDAVMDLGCTFFRIRGHINTSTNIALVKKVKSKRLDYEPKFIMTLWSPPAAYKVSGKATGADETEATNRLIEAKIPDYANYCVNLVKQYERETGIKLYAFSFANEPFFNKAYISCYYPASLYLKTLLAMKKTFVENNLNTIIFGAEDMAMNVLGQYYYLMRGSVESRNSYERLAVHGYAEDGKTPMNPVKSVQIWKDVKKELDRHGKPGWMTETSGFATDYTGAILYATSMMHALRYGNIAAWVFWTYSNFDSKDDVYELLEPNKKSKRYYIHKNFSRYIRPESVRINCTSSDSLIDCVAFVHPKNKTLTVVLLNPTSNAINFNLASSKLPKEFTKYVTTSTLNCADQGKIQPSASVELPAQSVVTLYGTNYATSVGTKFKANYARSTKILTNSKEGALYSISGRKISSIGSNNGLKVPSGVYLISNQSKNTSRLEFVSSGK